MKYFTPKNRLNSKGFSHVELLVLVVVVAAIAAVGVYVYKNTSGSAHAAALKYTETDVTYGTANSNQQLVVWKPSTDTTNNDPVAVVVHGNLWNNGKDTSISSAQKDLMSSGYVVVSADYTLITKNATKPVTFNDSYPAAVNDIEAALNWVHSDIANYGGNPSKVAMIGFSGGGTIAYQVSLTDHGSVEAVAGLSAPTDLTALASDNAVSGTLTIATKYLGCYATGKGTAKYGNYANCPTSLEQSASPVYYANQLASSSDCVPTFIANSYGETQVPYTQAQSYASALGAKGCDVEIYGIQGTGHANYWTTVGPLIISFFNNRLGV